MDRDEKHHEGGEKPPQRDWSMWLGLLTAFLVWVAAQVQDAFFSPFSDPPTLEQRIERLAASLRDAASAVSSMEAEIEQRRGLVEALERNAQVARDLAQTNPQQVEAVAHVLRLEIERDKRGEVWWTIGSNTLFTVVGAVMGVVASELWGRWKRRRRRPDDQEKA